MAVPDRGKGDGLKTIFFSTDEKYPLPVARDDPVSNGWLFLLSYVFPLSRSALYVAYRENVHAKPIYRIQFSMQNSPFNLCRFFTRLCGIQTGRPDIDGLQCIDPVLYSCNPGGTTPGPSLIRTGSGSSTIFYAYRHEYKHFISDETDSMIASCCPQKTP